MAVARRLPEGLRARPQEILEFAAQYACFDAARTTRNRLPWDADVMITDVWASMGQEGEAEARRTAFRGLPDQRGAHGSWQSPTPWCSTACPPTAARRSRPMSLRQHADEIFEEAENRLHAQKAVLVTLMEDKN